MNRKEFTNKMMTIAAGSFIDSNGLNGINIPVISLLGDKQCSDIPENLNQLIKNVLKLDYKTLNTDHDGSFLVEGLLRFADRGYKEGIGFAENWFNYHIEHDKKLTDEEYYKQYQGARSRILRESPLTFSIYSANLAVAFPVYYLYKLTNNKTAKKICLDVANAVLQYSARDRFGMLAHDDINFTNFCIPDGLYFGIRACAIASSLSKGEIADMYLGQSIYQLTQGIRYFMDEEKGLVRIGMFKGEPSKNYWCRSQGWLSWCICSLLRYLPESHPKFKEFTKTMKQIADGASKYQSKNGGFHVMVDDPSTPEEVTGMAMVLASVKEAVRNKWIPNQYDDLCKKGWDFIQKSVDKEGNVKNVYNGWAVPAEERRMDLMDKGYRAFINGIIIIAVDEMTR